MVITQIYWALFWAFLMVVGVMFVGIPIITMEGALASILGIFLSIAWCIAMVTKIIFRLTLAFSINNYKG